MKQSEIKELTITELQDKLGEYKKSYADLKMAHAISYIHQAYPVAQLLSIL